MKSAEVSAGAEILSSIYLFFGELFGRNLWLWVLGPVEFLCRSLLGALFMILLPGAGSLFEITKTRL